LALQLFTLRQKPFSTAIIHAWPLPILSLLGLGEVKHIDRDFWDDYYNTFVKGINVKLTGDPLFSWHSFCQYGAMKHLLVYLFLFAFFTSCIPLSFALNIKTDKVKLAKRFKRDLPKQQGFIFEDPKEADEFYTFINTKYQLPGMDRKIPLWIDKKPYITNVYERSRATNTVNFVPFYLRPCTVK
jgi:hypothetical protein